MLLTFSNLTAVWISRNYEDKIINDHLPCYSPPLTSLFVISFLVCRGNYCAWSNRFCYKNIGFLNICPPTAFFVLFVMKVMALVAGRERTCVTRLFRDIQIFSSICYMKLPLNRHTSINLLLQFNVDALKKLAQHILEKKIENPLKRYQERMRWHTEVTHTKVRSSLHCGAENHWTRLTRRGFV